MKEFARSWVPPALLRAARAFWPARTGLKGTYATWADACRESGGYGDAAILEKVDRVTWEALDSGKVCQDGVVTDAAPFPFPLAACLLRVVARKGSPITVIDFGGGLGSVWHRCRDFLEPAVVRWSIVEQPHFSARGRDRYQTEQLRFFDTLEHAAASARPDAMVFSSVLQYLQYPYTVLDAAAHLMPSAIIIDRTPYGERSTDLLTIQRVLPEIYTASYPLYIFGAGRIESHLAPRYRRVSCFPAVDGDWPHEAGMVHFRGEFYERSEQ
jgi:putative methyltransferase (TIGR04325 family)